MQQHDTYGDHDVEVWTFDWNERMSYVGVDREVVLEFEVTVQAGMSIDNIELVAARDEQALVPWVGRKRRRRPPPPLARRQVEAAVFACAAVRVGS